MFVNIFSNFVGEKTMTSFNEWLYQRDNGIYNEMFDDKYIPEKKFFDTDISKDSKGNSIVKISFTDHGMNVLRKLVRRAVNKEEGGLRLDKEVMGMLGNELLGRIKLFDSSAYKDSDIDVSSVRMELKDLYPQGEMALDAILRRFATRTGRRLGNDGNLLFTRSNALARTKEDPSISSTGRYSTKIKEREAEADKRERLLASRKEKSDWGKQSSDAFKSLLDF